MASEGAGMHEVAIVRQKYYCRVWPPLLIVDKGDQVTFRNLTQMEVTVKFSTNPFEDECPSQPIPAGGTTLCKVKGPSGEYPYEVLCGTTGLYAYAGSDPEMIVK